ncbi:hypothetical protein FI667_g2024, partial [Globisporangium splendens]
MHTSRVNITIKAAPTAKSTSQSWIMISVSRISSICILYYLGPRAHDARDGASTRPLADIAGSSITTPHGHQVFDLQAICDELNFALPSGTLSICHKRYWLAILLLLLVIVAVSAEETRKREQQSSSSFAAVGEQHLPLLLSALQAPCQELGRLRAGAPQHPQKFVYQQIAVLAPPPLPRDSNVLLAMQCIHFGTRDENHTKIPNKSAEATADAANRQFPPSKDTSSMHGMPLLDLLLFNQGTNTSRTLSDDDANDDDVLTRVNTMLLQFFSRAENVSATGVRVELTRTNLSTGITFDAATLGIPREYLHSRLTWNKSARRLIPVKEAPTGDRAFDILKRQTCNSTACTLEGCSANACTVELAECNSLGQKHYIESQVEASMEAVRSLQISEDAPLTS